MKKATVTVTFDDEKLGALEFSLRKDHSSVQEHLEDALNALYEKTVPEPLREYLDSKAKRRFLRSLLQQHSNKLLGRIRSSKHSQHRTLVSQLDNSHK